MENQGIFGGTISLLEKVLDLRSLKHSAIVSNIANLDTPNYKAFDLMIEKAIEEAAGTGKHVAIRKTDPEHLPLQHRELGNPTPDMVKPSEATVGGDGNSVDIDKAMADLSQNNLMYNALAQIVARKFTSLKTAMQDRRG